MHQIVYRPKFCSLETKIGQLEKIIIEKAERFLKNLRFSLTKNVSDRLSAQILLVRDLDWSIGQNNYGES